MVLKPSLRSQVRDGIIQTSLNMGGVVLTFIMSTMLFHLHSEWWMILTIWSTVVLAQQALSLRALLMLRRQMANSPWTYLAELNHQFGTEE